MIGRSNIAEPRVLILGARGQVGGAVARAARRRGWAHVRHARGQAFDDGLSFDLREQPPDPILDDTAPTLVVYAAAIPSVERCEAAPDETAVVNVEIPHRWASACAARGVRFLALSSEYVFDGENGPYDESAPPRPLNVYGAQKLRLERHLAALPEALVVRTSGVFGPDPRRLNFVHQLLEASVDAPLRVPSDQQITPTAADPLGDAILHVASRQAPPVLHLAGPEILGRVTFAARICALARRDPRVFRPVPTADLGLLAPRPKRAGLSTERARALGVRFPPLDESLLAFLEDLDH